MELEEFSSVQLRYEGDGAFVPDVGSWGSGVGTFSGDRLAGDFRFANRARLGATGVLLPTIHGALTVADGGIVLVQLSGVVMGERQRLAVTFETDAAPLEWLNRELGVFDGRVDHSAGLISGQLYLVK